MQDTARGRNLRYCLVITLVFVIGSFLGWAGGTNSVRVGAIALFSLAVLAAFGIQIAVFIPSALAKTEKFFDLAGSLTYLSITLALLVVVPQRTWVTWILAIVITLWAVRLGSFLFMRVSRSGSDGRFDKIKQVPLRFLQVWIIQGLWVSLTAGAAWIAMTSRTLQEPSILTWIGLCLWVLGFSIEVVADAQKSGFRAKPENRGRFITSGLWSISRHPNYLGEILLWCGVCVIAAPSFSGLQWVGVLSPLFVILLLCKVSGIPLLEKRADERWGAETSYQEYKSRTAILVPWVGKKR